MTLYDFHLHWYPGFDPARFLERLAALGAETGAQSFVGVVFDTDRVDCWGGLRCDFSQTGSLAEDGGSFVRVEVGGVRELLLLRGMQLVSEENLELLAIGVEPDYGPLDEMVANACEAGGAVVVPWGFGKWTGARRRVLEDLLGKSPQGLFLGDSGNRPGGRPSGVFRKFPALPRLDGSDPLPVAGDETFAFTGAMRGPAPEKENTASPEAFARFVRTRAGALKAAGRGVPVTQALRRQIRLRRRPLPLVPPKQPAPAGESDRSDLESSSDRYARRFGGAVGQCFLETQGELAMALAREVVEDAGADAPTVLDVGGGHAQLAPLFLGEGWEVTIFSSDESCRKRPDRILGPSAYDFKTGNLLRLPFADRSFDVVTAFRLVTHESQWERLLGELCRVARRAVIVDYPDVRGFNSLSRLLFRVKKAFEKDTREYAVFNRRRIREAFERNGAAEVVFRPQFFLPMVFHRITGSAPLLRLTEGFFRAVGLTMLFGSPVIARARTNPPPAP